MEQVPKKRNWFSRIPPRVRIALGVGVIAIAFILAFFAPPEGESSNSTADPEATPTVAITNLVDTVTINRGADVQGVHFTLEKAMEATGFSNDRKHAGTYTIRVETQAKNNGHSPVGLDYPSIVRLLLPDGEVIAPKYISLRPALLPDQPQTGFFDFPVSTRVQLSSLTLRIGNDVRVAFAAS